MTTIIGIIGLVSQNHTSNISVEIYVHATLITATEWRESKDEGSTISKCLNWFATFQTTGENKQWSYSIYFWTASFYKDDSPKGTILLQIFFWKIPMFSNHQSSNDSLTLVIPPLFHTNNWKISEDPDRSETPLLQILLGSKPSINSLDL